MLYLHIPFCKQACSYCNFHFSTSMKTRPAVLAAMAKELRMRRAELPAGQLPSVYFGGGTPSLLTEAELNDIFAVLRAEGYVGAAVVTERSRNAGAGNGESSVDEAGDSPDASAERDKTGNVAFSTTVSARSKGQLSARPTSQELPPRLGGRAEITLEANPDDLDDRTIATLAASPINRLSIGIQSFFEKDLTFMNRAHNAAEARAAVAKVNRAGFHDVSIDLIYGGQTTTDAMWAENLRIATDLGVTHISAYALTVEPKTALGVRVAKGKIADTDDTKFDRHFNMLVDHLTSHGYRHYEVSNFCLPGHESRHNSGYWSGQPYLGVGPGAHDFDGHRTRRWNVSNNAAYAKAWAEITSPADLAAANGFLYEQEVLTDNDRYNEYIMTGLRRDVGVSLAEMERLFGAEKARYFIDSQQGNLAQGLFLPNDTGLYRLSRAGVMRADGVAGDGFWV